jgi:hypothetical protein
VGRKIYPVIITVLVVLLALLIYLLRQGRITMLTDPWKAVSPEAAVVIETADLQNFMNSISADKGIFGELASVKEIRSFSIKVRYIASQLSKPGYKKLTGTSEALISLYTEKNEGLKPLLSMTIPANIRARHIKEILYASGIRKIVDRPFQRYSILELPYYTENGRMDTAWISASRGLLLCSSSEKILKKAIIQAGAEKDIRSTPGFTDILHASGKNADRVFVVFGNLGTLLPGFFKPESKLTGENASRLARCAEGDLFISNNSVVLTGYAEADDPSSLLGKFRDVNPGLLQTYKILPASTVFFETRKIGDLKHRASGNPGSDQKTTALADSLGKYIGDEITRAFIDIKDQDVNLNSLIIYRLRNRVYSEKIFLDAFAPEMRDDNVIYFKPDELVKIPVYRTSFKGFSSAVFPGSSDGFDDTFFAFYDNYLVTGSSYVTISRLLYDNLLNKTLLNDLNYRDFDGTLPSISSYFFYCVPSKLTEYLASAFNGDIINGLRNNRASLAKIQAVGYRLTSSNRMLFNTLSIKYKEEATEETGAEWETLLDTVAAIKPFFFTNHLTGAKEIFIQDIRNNAYLVNAAGRVLWKVPLNERINGNVYMIDYYRNGKFQLLFAGKNYLHLLDRNGNYVERYPVKLRSPATSSLSLFDYDNNKNYRLLIAGEDNRIYAYDRDGSVVKGWTPFSTGSVVNSDISWFRVSGKDYIVVSDESSLYFLDRQGNSRLRLKEPVTKAKNSAVRLIPGNEPYVVCTSPSGTIQCIYFDGSVKKSDVLKVTGDHSFDIFDVDGDGFGEYIFIDAGILYLYNHNRTALFKRDFGSKNLGGPISFIFSSSDRKIGVFDIDRNLIYLINEDGTTMNGFPLKGASMFSIGKLSDSSGWHLIVGGTDRFLYNYKLNSEVN